MPDLIDPYLTIEAGGQTLQPAAPATQNSRLNLNIPLPDSTTLALGIANGSLTQQGVWLETRSHVRLRTSETSGDGANKATSISLGATQTAVPTSSTPHGVAALAAGLNIWSDGQKNEYILQNVNEEYGANMVRRLAGTRTTTVVEDDKQYFNANQIVKVDENYNFYVGKSGGNYVHTISVTAEGEKEEHIRKDYDLFIGGHLERHIDGDMAELTIGFTNELKIGGANELYIGERMEVHAGLKLETTLGLTIEGFYGGKIELCPEKKKFHGEHFEANLNHSVVSLGKSTAAAYHQAGAAIERKSAAVRQWASGVDLANGMAQIRNRVISIFS